MDLGPGGTASLNDVGQVIVENTGVWQNGTVVIYPNPNNAAFTGINNLGDVVGNDDTGGFLTDLSGLFEIRVPVPPNFFRAYASRINDHDEVVGLLVVQNNPEFLTGFVWNRFIGGFVTFAPPGAIRTLPSGIDNQHTIVGAYFDGDHYHGFETTLQATPEPNTLFILIGCGALLFGSQIRFHRK